MGLTILHWMFLYILDILNEYGEYPRILGAILSVPHNIVMDLNDVNMYFGVKMRFTCEN